MHIDTLEDLYLEQLRDIHSAATQALEVATSMSDAASDGQLTKAIGAGVLGLQNGIAALEGIASRHEEDPIGQPCKGMEALVNDARTQAIHETFGDDAARDAMIIAQYHRLIHYTIAGYGYLAAFADRLHLDDDMAAMKHCLAVAYGDDRTMTWLATGVADRDAAG